MIQEYNKLVNSDIFKKWKARNKNSYLSSCFIMQDPNNKGVWSFDYYLPRINKLTTFVISDEITINPNQKIFEQTNKKLKEINLGDVKFSLENLDKIINKEVKNLKILKTIIILQYIDTLLWNVSLLGIDFNLINLKIDVKDGKTLDRSTTSVLQFKAS